MALSDDELDLIAALRKKLDSTKRQDELMWRYYRLQQRIEQLGMAIPPEMRNFMVVANWARTLVDGIRDRQQLRFMTLPGEEDADPDLREIAEANDLDARIETFNMDRLIYGRAFMSVGTNEDDADLPLMRVESPRQMSALIDTRRETMTAAGRFYRDDDARVQHVTLLLPDTTIWCERQKGRWVEKDRDEHNLGAVPVVMHLNRRMSGEWAGESQLTDIIPFVDSTARSLTNLQFAQEAHGVPGLFATGVSKGDFVDEHGKPVPQFEAYFDAIKILTDKDAKWGQFSAADLQNFDTAMNIYGRQASVVTAFPPDYFGITTTNPAGEGAIKATESRLIRSIEAQNRQVGMSLGWAGGLALRLRTGEWVRGNRVASHWFDPGTPTVAQRMDAVVKAKSVEILSREGAWDELGWSEARKDRERAYFEAEEANGLIARLLRPLPDDAPSNA